MSRLSWFAMMQAQPLLFEDLTVVHGHDVPEAEPPLQHSLWGVFHIQ
jgi:hypothetical protein